MNYDNEANLHILMNIHRLWSPATLLESKAKIISVQGPGCKRNIWLVYHISARSRMQERLLIGQLNSLFIKWSCDQPKIMLFVPIRKGHEISKQLTNQKTYWRSLGVKHLYIIQSGMYNKITDRIWNFKDINSVQTVKEGAVSEKKEGLLNCWRLILYKHTNKQTNNQSNTMVSLGQTTLFWASEQKKWNCL